MIGKVLENQILAACFFLAIDSLPINNKYLFIVYKVFEKKK